eukprot:Sspe_Gene.70635::Locus_41718_Transcript_1_5_Confidence_0.556_Length_1576::g.70635::m.70635
MEGTPAQGTPILGPAALPAGPSKAVGVVKADYFPSSPVMPVAQSSSTEDAVVTPHAKYYSDREGSVGSFTHTDCRSGRKYVIESGSPSIQTPTTVSVRKEIIGGNEMTFVPFAVFQYGRNQVHTKAVGYHSDGDVVLLREEITPISSSSDCEGPSAPKSILTTSTRIEQPVAEHRIENRGIRSIPGAAGPKGKNKRRRWRNQFFVDDEINAGLMGDCSLAKHWLTKEDYQELYMHRTPTEYSYVKVTEEKHVRILTTPHNPPKPKHCDPQSATARFERIGRALRSEFTRIWQKRVLYLKGLEQQIRDFLTRVDDGCIEDTMVVPFDDSYHRMLGHGICSYYNLNAVAEQNSSNLVVHAPAKVVFPPCTLIDFMGQQDLEKEVPLHRHGEGMVKVRRKRKSGRF